MPSARNVSEGLQEFNQVGFLPGCEIQGEQLIVVIDHSQKIRRTAIVEIWRMLPEPALAASSGIVRGRPVGICRIHSVLPPGDAERDRPCGPAQTSVNAAPCGSSASRVVAE